MKQQFIEVIQNQTGDGTYHLSLVRRTVGLTNVEYATIKWGEDVAESIEIPFEHYDIFAKPFTSGLIAHFKEEKKRFQNEINRLNDCLKEWRASYYNLQREKISAKIETSNLQCALGHALSVAKSLIGQCEPEELEEAEEAED